MSVWGIPVFIFVDITCKSRIFLNTLPAVWSSISGLSGYWSLVILESDESSTVS